MCSDTGVAAANRSTLVVGGTSGIGLALARSLAASGEHVTISGRSRDRASEVARSISGRVDAVALDVSDPATIVASLKPLGRLDGLVLAAVERDANSVAEYDIARATRLTVLKLVGYTETVHALLDRLEPSVETGVVLFGGRAKDLPYPGSTTVSTINGGVVGMTATLAKELAPIRVNSLHPGIIGDSPFWASKPEAVLDGYRSRTPGGQLATMLDVVEAVRFLLTNRGVSGTDLYVDRGWRLT